MEGESKRGRGSESFTHCITLSARMQFPLNVRQRFEVGQIRKVNACVCVCVSVLVSVLDPRT